MHSHQEEDQRCQRPTEAAAKRVSGDKRREGGKERARKRREEGKERAREGDDGKEGGRKEGREGYIEGGRDRANKKGREVKVGMRGKVSVYAIK